MNRAHASTWRWLAAIVAGHLVLSIIHGSAHTGANVSLSPAATLFVYVVILAGLALAWPSRRPGGWVVALAMAAAFVFGVVNHFMLPGPDHVAHVAEPWRWLFGSTAALLAITEAIGCGVALRIARGAHGLSAPDVKVVQDASGIAIRHNVSVAADGRTRLLLDERAGAVPGVGHSRRREG